MLESVGPAYMRVGRPDVPIVYGDDPDFTLGKANELRSGNDITLIANGIMVSAALEAAHALAADGVEARVLDMHTVRPLDVEAVTRAARETGKIVGCRRTSRAVRARQRGGNGGGGARAMRDGIRRRCEHVC